MSNIIIYLPNEPLGKQGGMERVTHGLAEMLRDAGHKVLLLCRVKNKLGESYEAPVSIVFIPNGMGRKKERKFINNLICREKTEFVIDQTEGGIIGKWGVFSNRNQIISLGVTLIAVQHNSQYSYLKYYYLIKRKNFPASLSGRIRSFVYNDIFLKIKRARAWILQKRLFRSLILNYDKIITLSQGGISEFHKLYPHAPAAKLATIPNPIPYSATNGIACRKERRCLFVGRLDNAAKGIDRLLRIWNLVEKKLPGWHLDIVGDGQDANWLKELACELSLNNVSFEGFQDPVPYYERSTLFCMTSTFEGFGLVLAEAMQHGCVPLAFDSYPAVRDIILPGETGVLIQPFDEKAYADKLISLTAHPEDLSTLSKNARKHTQVFSPEKISFQWNTLIQNHLSRDNITVLPHQTQ